MQDDYERVRDEAEERDRIGNTPTCPICGEQHNPERECESEEDESESVRA